MRVDIPAMVRSNLPYIIGHERDLIGSGVFDEADEVGVGVPFDVVFGVRELAANEVCEDGDVALADVALIGPRVDGEAVGPGRKRYSPEMLDARPRQIAAIAQEGDGIHVDGELGGHDSPSPGSEILFNPARSASTGSSLLSSRIVLSQPKCTSLTWTGSRARPSSRAAAV